MIWPVTAIAILALLSPGAALVVAVIVVLFVAVGSALSGGR